MRIRLMPILLILPLLEIAGFIIVGRQIGVLATIGLILATSLAGSLLLRAQGLSVLTRIREEVAAGQVPRREMVHGVMIAAAGFLLFLPGFLTDIVGLLLFLPPVRDYVWSRFGRRVVGTAVARRGATTQPTPQSRHAIDLEAGEYSARPDPKSPWRGPRPG